MFSDKKSAQLSTRVPYAYGKRGFLLLEYSMVCALIVCIMMIAIGSNECLYRWQVRSEIDILYATACYLQQRALATNQAQCLTFNIDDHTYSFGKTTYRLPPVVRFGSGTGALGPPSAPSKPIVNACSFSERSIIFWPDGIIKAGTVYLVDRKQRDTFALSSGIGSIACLRKYHYKQGAWFCLE